MAPVPPWPGTLLKAACRPEFHFLTWYFDQLCPARCRRDAAGLSWSSGQPVHVHYNSKQTEHHYLLFPFTIIPSDRYFFQFGGHLGFEEFVSIQVDWEGLGGRKHWFEQCSSEACRDLHKSLNNYPVLVTNLVIINPDDRFQNPNGGFFSFCVKSLRNY